MIILLMAINDIDRAVSTNVSISSMQMVYRFDVFFGGYSK